MITVPKLDSSRFKSKRCIVGLATSAILILTLTPIVVVLANIDKKHIEADHHWNYYEQDKWPGLCNTGQMQSPIALSETSASKSVITPLNIENVDYFERFEVDNNGHTVTIRFGISNHSPPKLSGGGLLKNYTLDNLHFHWPSEHTIDGIQYPLEGHFVFFADGYRNLTNALRYPYGVTVIAVLFAESNTAEHDNFKVIDDAVKQIPKTGESAVSKGGLMVNSFFPEDNEVFFKYTGSLTTPECNENINWIVFKDPSYILEEDYLMSMFRLGWNRAMEIVHLEQWVQFMDDGELETCYKQKLNVSKDSFRVSEMSTYEKNFLDKDIDTLAREIHRRKFSEVLHKMQMNMKLMKIMDQMEVYYMYHLDEPCPDILKKNVQNRITRFMEQHKMKGGKIPKMLLWKNEEGGEEDAMRYL